MHLRLAVLASLALGVSTAHAQPSYLDFEAGHVRPVAMSPDGTRLFVVNTPDDRLEIFDLTGAMPIPIASVPVGLSPVAVAAESDARVWVVNHLSDSVSIVDVASDPPRVISTLLVGDEPSDVVFAGASPRRAFVTTAHRGQSHPTPRGEYDVPGVGRADVWVFDALVPAAPTIVRLFGDRPRALAVSADGSTVYAAVFQSGNRTTVVNEGRVCDGGPLAAACGTGPGGLPPPVTNAAGDLGPEVGLIVRYDPERGVWHDELDRDWSESVRFDLPDYDVFAIDAATLTETASHSGVGTVLYGMATNPISGELYVSNTEAFNDVRFEGPGRYVRELGLREGHAATVRGHLHEARVTVVDGASVTPVHLNPHIDYGAARVAPGTRDRSIATPIGMAVSSDGSTLYLAAYGSNAVAVLDTAELAAGRAGDSRALIRLSDAGPVGPSGLVLDEARGRMYVATRFDDALVTVDLASRAVIGRARLHTPEPESTITGRPMLYDAYFTSSNGEASCGSCHVFGDLDGLAWDLGNPDDTMLDNPNPFGPIGVNDPFHPLKGPMTTQTFRGISDSGPLHWRGDRTGAYGSPASDPLDELAGFTTFNVAFEGLLGRDEGPLRDEEMRRFAEFAMGIVSPPSPIRRLDNGLRADEARGERIYFDREAIDAVATCNGCHTMDRSIGAFGTGGEMTFENETQNFKVAHLRNVYQKVGMFGMPEVDFFLHGDNEHMGPQVRGFGYLHDGSTDTIFRFLRAGVFNFGSDAERRDVEAFVMACDSTLAPITGQQVTLDASSDAAVDARIDLLIARAGAAMQWPNGGMTTECELVVRGVWGGEARGWLLEADGLFHSDRASEPPLTDAELRAIGRAGALTYTCAPPGAGVRMALDRDEDGAYDRDELDAGDDPASRPLIEIPDPDLPEVPPTPDGGMPSLDGGLDAGRVDGGVGTEAGGCGCRAAGASDRAPVMLLALLALLVLRRRS